MVILILSRNYKLAWFVVQWLAKFKIIFVLSESASLLPVLEQTVNNNRNLFNTMNQNDGLSKCVAFFCCSVTEVVIITENFVQSEIC